MKKIIPYKSSNEAISSLDNGGRFYNILTKAEDGIISGAELGKVGGIFNNKQKMMLFLELSISDLDQQSKDVIISKLDNDLEEVYEKYKPQYLLPSEAQSQGIISSNAIITGVPKLTESKSDFNGFLMVPVVTNNVTTFIMIPLIDKYDVYEVRDEASADTFFIAHTKGSKKLPEKKIKVAGVLKELKANKEEKKASKKFLETLYYLDLE
ncbi:hypothetical protein [Aquimarina sp. 2201CG5-10]|uniref:hypothetical protein n=1 Tax=Aquimarina callyspongiae TaxID=3098150 RepID=UPI002AB5DE02|nr:hypothetical protein [Aquimarina sp. 2201CG5-10]MDY8135183.1 hypothetical protein [Aquimarina sp. 2201CG5-10]